MKPDLNTARRFLAAKCPAATLLVGITGAHYYGFPSPDSDLDMKGIHVAPTGEIVSLSPPTDTLDHLGVFEGVEIDYTSHEIAAALRLLLKGNGNILERVLSPFQVIKSPAMTELQQLARGAISKKFFHHYRGFFGRMCQDWKMAEPQTLKGLLYAYRSALTGIHLLLAGECIGDVTKLAPIYGFPLVADLVARKAAGAEHGALASGGHQFEGDLKRLEAALENAQLESQLSADSQNAAALNAFLVRIRREHFAPD